MHTPVAGQIGHIHMDVPSHHHPPKLQVITPLPPLLGSLPMSVAPVTVTCICVYTFVEIL